MPAPVRIGTCSFADEALVAHWYPRGVPARDRLGYYAERFSTVEIDSTFYRLPSEQMARNWAERTPPGFVIHVKAFGVMTRHPVPLARLPPELREDRPGQPSRSWPTPRSTGTPSPGSAITGASTPFGSWVAGLGVRTLAPRIESGLPPLRTMPWNWRRRPSGRPKKNSVAPCSSASSTPNGESGDVVVRDSNCMMVEVSSPPCPYRRPDLWGPGPSHGTYGRVTAWLSKRVEFALAQMDLTLPQYRVLGILAEGSAAASRLADRLAVRPSSITAIIDGLEAKGFVDRGTKRTTVAASRCVSRRTMPPRRP